VMKASMTRVAQPALPLLLVGYPRPQAETPATGARPLRIPRLLLLRHTKSVPGERFDPELLRKRFGRLSVLHPRVARRQKLVHQLDSSQATLRASSHHARARLPSFLPTPYHSPHGWMPCPEATKAFRRPPGGQWRGQGQSGRNLHTHTCARLVPRRRMVRNRGTTSARAVLSSVARSRRGESSPKSSEARLRGFSV